MIITFFIIGIILFLYLFWSAIKTLLRIIYLFWCFIRCKERKRVWLETVKGNNCTYTDGSNTYVFTRIRTSAERCVDIYVYKNLIWCPYDNRRLCITMVIFFIYVIMCATIMRDLIQILVLVLYTP